MEAGIGTHYPALGCSRCLAQGCMALESCSRYQALGYTLEVEGRGKLSGGTARFGCRGLRVLRGLGYPVLSVKGRSRGALVGPRQGRGVRIVLSLMKPFHQSHETRRSRGVY